MKPFLLAFLVLILNTLGAPTEPVDDAARLEQSKNLLEERLNQKRYVADASVLEAMEYFSSRNEQVNSKLWILCALFYNPDWHSWIERGSVGSKHDLWHNYPFFAIAEGNGATRMDRAVLMVQVFSESNDPFVKVQFASFYSIWFTRGDRDTDSRFLESVSSGVFSQATLDDFLATSQLVASHALNLDVHQYGELQTDFLRQISESPIQIPWLRRYVQAHPLPPLLAFPQQEPEPMLQQTVASVPEAPRAEVWSTTSLGWLGLFTAIVVGLIAWLCRSKRKQRNHAQDDK
jgi:hypothetical protein